MNKREKTAASNEILMRTFSLELSSAVDGNCFILNFSSGISIRNRHRDPNAKTKKTVIILLICIIGFVTLVMIFTRLGRWSAADDPFLDVLANPNVRVEGD